MKPRAVCAGVDGCKKGWIAVFRQGNARPEVGIFRNFSALMGALPQNAIVAVDMPMGLPEFIGVNGRGPERAIRPNLGKRKSSVFSIPSRSAVYASTFAQACAAARLAFDPPRALAIQAFGIFPKIREIDGLMTRALEARVYEVHPELAFWRLNGERAMAHAKKSRAGADERRELLVRHGIPADFLGQPVPAGAAVDDFLDAAACLLIAGRIAAGQARPFPDPPLFTEAGARMAIWA